MARSFIGFGQSPYIGVLQPFPNHLVPGSFIIPAFLNWLSYGASSAKPNVNVLTDMTQAPRLKDSWKIRSVYIDNLNSNVPIYVFFPDSGFAVVAPPNSTDWYPAFTNGRTAWIIGEGFATGAIPSTLIYFSDALMIPYSISEFDQSAPLYRASSLITRGSTIYNTNFGIPALGDQNTSGTVAANLLGGVAAVNFSVPPTSGFWYITGYQWVLVNNNATATTQGACQFESTGPTGTVLVARYACIATADEPVTQVESLPCQLKLSALESYQVRIVQALPAGSAAQARLRLIYSFNPD